MGTPGWFPHRWLPLAGQDVAVLADKSSGWCVLRRGEYAAVDRYLRDAEHDLSTVPPAERTVLTLLWEAGLLCRDGEPHPQALHRPSAYPNEGCG